MRLIDADALKETIASNVYPVVDDFNSRDYGMFWTGGIEKAIDQQPTIEPERKPGRWIPCTERMPDIDEDGYTDKVLVSFDHYSGVDICEYRITDGVGRWYAGDTDDSPEDIDLQVTAWMPLPEPYRAERRTDEQTKD